MTVSEALLNCISAALDGRECALTLAPDDWTALLRLAGEQKLLPLVYAAVRGTPGWTDRLGELQELCRERGGALFYASNYCLGVNLMFRLNRQLAAMIDRVGGYDVRIEEVHHTQKKDAPSGTAITLAEGIAENLAGKQGWVNLAPGIEHAANRIERSGEAPADRIEIRSVRKGAVPGIHTVTYESEDDVLEIRHTIKNRRTLALGAVVAAEFLCGKQGVYSMDDLLRNA